MSSPAPWNLIIIFILFYNLLITITLLSFIDGENFKLLPCCIQELQVWEEPITKVHF